MASSEEFNKVEDNCSGHPLIFELTEQEVQPYEAKSKNYSKGGDPMANFKRVSATKRLYPYMRWDSPTGVALLPFYDAQFSGFQTPFSTLS